VIYVLYTLFFVSCIVLVGAVLLQPGKTDAGALFTSNVSSNAFGPRGTATVLSKITIVAAVVFMLSALMISMPALTGNISLLNAAEEAPVEQPATNPADNTNGALIETPATEAVKEEASNSANAASSSNSSANANSNPK
jgi:preprotein translocase subunit SecG